MDYVQFGRTGVRVSPLCLGCWNFGHVTGEEDAVRIVNESLDAGINFIDTANVYTHGESEQMVGKALAERKARSDVFLATKVRSKMGDDPNDYGATRRHIFEQVDQSLERLRTDWIDLYQIHWPDYDTPIDETLRAMDDLIRMGKVRYVGTSNHPAWRGVEGLWAAERLGLNRFVSEQPPYSIFRRGAEEDVLPFCEKYDLAVIPYSPLAGGWLSGKYTTKNTAVKDDGRMKGRADSFDTEEGRVRLEKAEQLVALAESRGTTLSRFALAWVRTNPAITAPIIGPRTPEQLADNLASLGVDITADDREKIDEIVAPETNIA